MLPNLSVSGAWHKRDTFNQAKTDNLLVDPTDYTAFQTNNPLTNQPITIYNLNANKVGKSDVLDTTATDTSLNRKGYRGFEASANVRPPRGASVFGGWWSDKDIAVTCDGDNPNTFLYCDQSVLKIPFVNNLKVAGAIPLPFDVQIGTSLVSYAGAPLSVSWVVPANLFPGGRNAAVTVPLIAPGTKYQALVATRSQCPQRIHVRQAALRGSAGYVQRVEQ